MYENIKVSVLQKNEEITKKNSTGDSETGDPAQEEDISI